MLPARSGRRLTATRCSPLSRRARTGVGLDVLSGPDEAKLTFMAIRRWFGWSAGTLLMVDIGGGFARARPGPGRGPRCRRLAATRRRPRHPRPAGRRSAQAGDRARSARRVRALAARRCARSPRRPTSTRRRHVQDDAVAGAHLRCRSELGGMYAARHLDRAVLSRDAAQAGRDDDVERQQLQGSDCALPRSSPARLWPEAAMDLLGVERPRSAHGRCARESSRAASTADAVTMAALR